LPIDIPKIKEMHRAGTAGALQTVSMVYPLHVGGMNIFRRQAEKRGSEWQTGRVLQ
jgi:hypothetical protein